MAYSSPVLFAVAAFLGAEVLPDTATRMAGRASRLWREGRTSEARVLYEKALDLDGRNGATLAGLGRIHLSEHRRLQALRHLARAYQANPNDPAVVRDYAAAVGDTKLEAVLQERLVRLPSTLPEDRERAVTRLSILQGLNGRIVNQLVSGYQLYRLRMPVAQSGEGIVHGWILRVSLNGSRPLRLLLDTGSRGILIDRRLAAPLGLELLADTKIGGFGGGPSEKAQVMLAGRAQIDGQLEMATLPLDVEGVLASIPMADAGDGMAAGTRIGHVHLQVAALPAAEAVYVGALGFEPTARLPPGALFVSAGGYHHHLGLNTWAGVGAPAPRAGSRGMSGFTIAFLGTTELRRTVAAVRDAGVDVTADDAGRDVVTDPSGNRAVLLVA